MGIEEIWHLKYHDGHMDENKEVYIIDKYGVVRKINGAFLVTGGSGCRIKNGIYLEEGEELANTDTKD